MDSERNIHNSLLIPKSPSAEASKGNNDDTPLPPPSEAVFDDFESPTSDSVELFVDEEQQDDALQVMSEEEQRQEEFGDNVELF